MITMSCCRWSVVSSGQFRDCSVRYHYRLSSRQEEMISSSRDEIFAIVKGFNGLAAGKTTEGIDILFTFENFDWKKIQSPFDLIAWFVCSKLDLFTHALERIIKLKILIARWQSWPSDCRVRARLCFPLFQIFRDFRRKPSSRYSTFSSSADYLFCSNVDFRIWKKIEKLKFPIDWRNRSNNKTLFSILSSDSGRKERKCQYSTVEHDCDEFNENIQTKPSQVTVCTDFVRKPVSVCFASSEIYCLSLAFSSSRDDSGISVKHHVFSFV